MVGVLGMTNLASDTHRGWLIGHDYPPIPWRNFDWTATSPDFDASYEGPEDGWVESGTIFHGASREAVIAQVDAWLAEEVEL